ncbi:hypothetical protein NADFUDRAFT_49368 [Nadsonia fulvescens var. elongata DSM 6958]|uniref:Uncharacterized protein n=1 Tax=Nadsonia fulvescens var. elongata DSM 6958 TaxID=857566 RepID=A0A1E3PPZ5_9ASCO|nr:hypothetical protein NADFUDRAFT_49368 [Nadsonia fulvescens var. elongata DSM 6958]
MFAFAALWASSAPELINVYSLQFTDLLGVTAALMEGRVIIANMIQSSPFYTNILTYYPSIALVAHAMAKVFGHDTNSITPAILYMGLGGLITAYPLFLCETSSVFSKKQGKIE